MKINKDQWTSTINQWKSLKIHENQYKFLLKINEDSIIYIKNLWAFNDFCKRFIKILRFFLNFYWNSITFIDFSMKFNYFYWFFIYGAMSIALAKAKAESNSAAGMCVTP